MNDKYYWKRLQVFIFNSSMVYEKTLSVKAKRRRCKSFLKKAGGVNNTIIT